MGLYLGTTGADTIIGGSLTDKFAQIDAGADNDVIYLETGQSYLTGSGNDIIYGSKTGKTWYNSVQLDLPVKIDVEKGLVTDDGFGNQDQIFDIYDFQIGRNSTISFGTKNGYVSINGSGSTVYAGTGQVTVQFFANSYDCLITEKQDGSLEILNKITNELNYLFDKPNIQFNDLLIRKIIGTAGDDTIQGGTLTDKYANIDSGSGNDVVYLEQGQTYLTGQGNDIIYGSESGRTWYNTAQINNRVDIDVGRGLVIDDGFGNQDRIYDIDAFIIGSNSKISFGNNDGILNVIGTGNTIYAGKGQVSVQFYSNSYDCLLIEKKRRQYRDN